MEEGEEVEAGRHQGVVAVVVAVAAVVEAMASVMAVAETIRLPMTVVGAGCYTESEVAAVVVTIIRPELQHRCGADTTVGFAVGVKLQRLGFIRHSVPTREFSLGCFFFWAADQASTFNLLTLKL